MAKADKVTTVILRRIRDFIAQRQAVPTVEEFAKQNGISARTVHEQMRRLQKVGNGIVMASVSRGTTKLD